MVSSEMACLPFSGAGPLLSWPEHAPPPPSCAPPPPSSSSPPPDAGPRRAGEPAPRPAGAAAPPSAAPPPPQDCVWMQRDTKDVINILTPAATGQWLRDWTIGQVK